MYSPSSFVEGILMRYKVSSKYARYFSKCFRVELLIIDHYLMKPNTSLDLCHLCFILSVLNVTRVLPKALEIIFEVQKKRSNEKIARRKIRFSTYKTQFSFLLLLFGLLLFSKVLTFSFLIRFKQFKVL